MSHPGDFENASQTSGSGSGESSEDEAGQRQQRGRRLAKRALLTAFGCAALGGAALLGLGVAPGPAVAGAKEYFLARISNHHIISEAGVAFAHRKDTWCNHAQHSFPTLAAAQAACTAPFCPGIYSIKCNPVFGYALCKNGAVAEASEVGSCTFMRDAGAPRPPPGPPLPPPSVVPAKPVTPETVKDLEKKVATSSIPTDAITSPVCKVAVFAMMKGMCPPGGGLQTTCDPPKAALEGSCRGWFQNVVGIDEATKQRRINECLATAKQALDREAQTRVAAANPEEAALCIRCNPEACTQKPTWVRAQDLTGVQPAPEPPTQRAPADGGPNHCRPIVNGQVVGVQRRVRREIHQWNDYDFVVFSKAVNDFRNRGAALEFEHDWPNTHGSFTAIHKYGHPDGPFLPWHRKHLLEWETQLQKISNNCSLTVPYWNSNLEAGEPLKSFVFHPSRYGGQGGSPTSPGGTPCRMNNGRMGYCLVNGIAANWKIPGTTSLPQDSCGRCVHRSPQYSQLADSITVLAQLQATSNFQELDKWLGDVMHVVVHWGTIGGSMGDLPVAPRDPTFYLHHAYVDRLFDWWQRYHAARGVDTSNIPDYGRIMRYWNQPAGEWVGKHDLKRGCTLLPASNPRVCLEFETEMPVPEARR